MGYIRENQVLLDEELCAKPLREDGLTKSTILFRENLNLVGYIVKRFYTNDPSIDFDDLIQEGYIGLWIAACRFDESIGYAFSTYAVPMIMGTINRFLRESAVFSRGIKVTRSVYDVRVSINKHKFSNPLSKDDIDILISEGHSQRDIDACLALYSVPSINDTVLSGTNEETDLTIEGQITIIDNSINVYDSLSDEDMSDLIEELLKYASPLHRDMIEEWMYSIWFEDKLSQARFSRKYNISQSMVSRIISKFQDNVRKNKKAIYEFCGL